MLFEEIYELHFKDVYRFLCGLTKDEQLAEELVQEAFFKALKAMLSGAVALMLLSSYPLAVAWIAPVRLTTNGTILSSAVCVVVISAVLRVQTYLYCKRGAPYNGAMY